MKKDWDEISKIIRSTRVDLSKPIEQEPTAISMGYLGQSLIPIGTYGNFSCITGVSKSFKSFLKTAMVAGYIGGNSTNYFGELRGHDTRDKLIMDFDTEQSAYHVSKAGKRVLRMVGSDYPLYQVYKMRHLDPKIRLQVIEHELYRAEGAVGLVCIDGIADLLDNINDPEGSNMVVGKLLEWSAELNCHIITILHRNISRDNSKPTGWIGTSVTKKAETVLKLTRNEPPDKQSTTFPIIEVSPEYTRGLPFQKFSFTLSGEILPKQTETEIAF